MIDIACCPEFGLMRARLLIEHRRCICGHRFRSIDKYLVSHRPEKRWVNEMVAHRKAVPNTGAREFATFPGGLD